jgi:uncharacterized membrane protein YebE (DUF533 family)
MIKKLILLALTSGLAAKAYKAYLAKHQAEAAAPPAKGQPTPRKV